MQCSCLILQLRTNFKYNNIYLLFSCLGFVTSQPLFIKCIALYFLIISVLLKLSVFQNAIFRCTLEICLFFSFVRVLHSSNRSLTVSTRENLFPWKVPAVSLLSLKSFDCCEVVLFSSCPRAAAGGEVINMAGKMELG